MFIVTVCVPVCDLKSFETYLKCLFKPFSYITKEVKKKNLNTLRTKKVFKMK